MHILALLFVFTGFDASDGPRDFHDINPIIIIEDIP